MNVQNNVVQANGHPFVLGLAKGVPIVIGYVPIAISYGVIATQAGIPLFYTVLMSLIVYAGASQFMAVNMIVLGAAALEIVFATLVLNFRHFVMSMSWVNKEKHLTTPWKTGLTCWLTDETFAVSMLKLDDHEAQGPLFSFGLMVSAYCSWVVGSLLGGLLASLIPAEIGASMSMGLYAMFIGLLVPAVRVQWRVGIVAVFSAIIATLLQLIINMGWAIVVATVVAGLLGVWLIDDQQ